MNGYAPPPIESRKSSQSGWMLRSLEAGWQFGLLELEFLLWLVHLAYYYEFSSLMQVGFFAPEWEAASLIMVCPVVRLWLLNAIGLKSMS